MRKYKTILETIQDCNPEALKMDGFDDCIIGICYRAGSPDVLVYSESKIIKKLTKDMTMDEAIDYYGYNIRGAYMGDNAPVIVWQP